MTDDQAIQDMLDTIKAMLDSQHERITKLQTRLLRTDEPPAKLDSPSQV